MLEPLDSYFIGRYLMDLRKELAIHGIADGRQEEILGESQIHLEEAMAAAAPQTAEEVMRVIRRFGDAKAMAKKLAAESNRIVSRRRFLWPAVLLVLGYLILRSNLLTATLFAAKRGTWQQSGFTVLGHHFLPSGLWIGTVFLVACAAALFVMGFRSRRLLFGQFALAGVGLLVVQTAWLAATSYPVAHMSRRQVDWVEPVPRADADRWLAMMETQKVRTTQIERLLIEGQAVFTPSGFPSQVPTSLMADGQYLMPEGVSEVTRGIPAREVHAHLLTSSWKEAVKGWTDKHRWPGKTEASAILDQTPEDMAYFQSAIDHLKWVRNQSLGEQILLDLRPAATSVLACSVMSLLATWAGWLFWVSSRLFQRAVRRASYGGRAWGQARG